MGAFDGELYALGYRFYTSGKKSSKKDEFIGPRWSGDCVGYCSSTKCRPCPANNRISQEELEDIVARQVANQEYFRTHNMEQRAIKENANIRNIFPEVPIYIINAPVALR